MEASYQLFMHNALFLFGGVLNILVALAVMVIRRKELDTIAVTFVLTALSVAIFQISHVFGILAPTAEISRKIFMFNLAVIPINVFMTHWFLAVIGKTKSRRWPLIAVYASGGLLLAIHLIFPSTYLVDSVPKLYFPFYYEPGSLQWVTRVWFNIVGIYYFTEMTWAYRHEKDPIKRNRYLYVLIAILYAFVVGSTAILLVYDVPFDPMWSGFFSFFTLIIAYAVVKYQLLDVRLIIQRAFVYGMSLAALVAFISFSNSLTDLLAGAIPGFPRWIVPVVSSTIGVLIGIFFWRKLRENDVMKYEFITIIAHKFRTPLTQVKWTLEEMLGQESESGKRERLETLLQSSEKLIDLTGALVELTDTDQDATAQFTFEDVDICQLVAEVGDIYKSYFQQKNIFFSYVCGPEPVHARIDRKRMQFVLQTLLENAAVYTPEGGRVSIEAGRRRTSAVISVTDSGIGMTKDDISRVSTKFYRSAAARTADTEGFGIGLYLARSVARRHGGKMEVFSEGLGKGSTFRVILPAVEGKED